MTVPGRSRGAEPPSSSSRAARAPPRRVPLRRLLRVASVACGVQFGWALQLSLLTPYVQELGIPHEWASLVWLCGPLSGLLVQPLVGHMSDRCTSSFGRRCPFIAGGAISIAAAVLIVGHSSDIGLALGDPTSPGSPRPRTIAVYLIGFWLLDVGNNATQGPCRALLADLAGNDQRRTRIANAYFSLFMAFGNILGFAAGSYSGWFTILPFTVTPACSINCANLKSAFLIDVLILMFTAYISISSAQEVPIGHGSRVSDSPEETHLQVDDGHEAFLWELMGSFRYLTLPVWMVLIVTAVTWLGWFPFFLFDTDWMGREIYKGSPSQGQNYNNGVRMGAFGLMLNSIFLGLTSVSMEKLCKKWGAGLIWGIGNIIMSICFLFMVILSLVSKNMDYDESGFPPNGLVVCSVVIFAILGAPLAVTYSIPYAMISARIEHLRLGQGLSMGILNLAIVLPQMLVSVGSGPWDQLFGGGNSPAFAVAAFAAFIGGLMAIIGLPRSKIARRKSQR